MQSKTHTTFPHLESKSQFYDTKLSVLSAVNKLKEAEEKIMQARKRQLVQKRIQQAKIAREKQIKKLGQFKKIVRTSLQIDKRVKCQVEVQREKHVQKLHQVNMQRKKDHEQVISTVQNLKKSNTSKIHQIIQSNKKKNQQAVREFKKRQIEQKIKRRISQAEREQRSRERIKSFRQSRINFIKKDREREVSNLETKIQLRYRYLNKLQQANDSRVKWRSRSFVNQKDKQKSMASSSNAINPQSEKSIQQDTNETKKKSINSEVNKKQISDMSKQEKQKEIHIQSQINQKLNDNQQIMDQEKQKHAKSDKLNGQSQEKKQQTSEKVDNQTAIKQAIKQEEKNKKTISIHLQDKPTNQNKESIQKMQFKQEAQVKSVVQNSLKLDQQREVTK